jgi:hypothetical protein
MGVSVSRTSKSVAAATVVVLSLVLGGCATSQQKDTPATTGVRSKTGSTKNPPTTPTTGAQTPTLYAATYTDSPLGQPGYALVVNPGSTGRGTMGGIAVYQYQDGKEVAFFSFHGRASSLAPFTLSIKGDRAASSATAQVTVAPTIIIENCGRLFSPAVSNAAEGEAVPSAPPSCTFSYKLAPSLPPSQPTVATNLTATPAINAGLLHEYLVQNGWLAQYGSDISLDPGTTYVAYDPQTGLNWAYATFHYTGPDTDSSGSPDVAMQDGGDEGFFYQIPNPKALPSNDDGWVMVGVAGEPRCLAQSVIPSPVISLWGLVDPPECSSPN